MSKSQLKHYATLTFVVLLFSPFQSFSQNSFGLRVTPNIIMVPKVYNPSEALIYGELRLAFDGGLDYSHSLNKNFSISTGVNIGIVDHNEIMVAPVDAFGNGGGRQVNIYSNSGADNFLYTGLSVAPIYHFTTGRSTFHFSAGPNVRLYHDGSESHISRRAFNRTTPWNPDTDPADFEVNLPATGGTVFTDMTTSLTIERRISARANFHIGLRYNHGLKPISEGTMYINMYGQRYDGRFAVRSNYIGLDFQLRYLSKAPMSGYNRLIPVASDNQDFRRAIYIDVLGSSPLMSLNYEMRVKRHQNNGLGFRVGFGLGAFTESDYIKAPRYFSIPLGLNYIIGSKQHSLEAGAGYTVQFITSNPPDVPNTKSFKNFNFGYRFQPLKDGLLFRAYWSPDITTKGFYPAWAGISLGYSFR